MRKLFYLATCCLSFMLIAAYQIQRVQVGYRFVLLEYPDKSVHFKLIQIHKWTDGSTNQEDDKSAIARHSQVMTAELLPEQKIISDILIYTDRPIDFQVHDQQYHLKIK